MGCAIVKNPSKSSEESNSTKTSLIQLKSSLIHNIHPSHLSDYISISFLGAGAFGEVLSVNHLPSKTSRAIKILSKNKFCQTTLKSVELLKESSILSKLNHPNIIKFYEVFEDSLNFYIITELCKGGSLDEKLKKVHKFSEDVTIEIMKQVLDAFEYMHNMHLIHRDIKLENILFSNLSSNYIKIIDFGCSIFLHPGQTLDNLCGSLFYLAPEVVNRNYTEKADIWSCGILALIMLTGVNPYKGLTKDEIKDKIKNMTSNEMIEKIPLVSSEGQDFIKQMLEIDPNKRIAADKARKHNWLNKV